MALYVKIFVNDQLIADAKAVNLSELTEISDYMIKARESGSDRLGIPSSTIRSILRKHKRNQTVWALVEQIARIAASELGCGLN